MKLIKNPVKGMKDILPDEMKIREYCLDVIKNTYAGYGYTRIETPVVENIENLQSNQGGDNEKLIFKILKRGEKFSLEGAACENDLVDCGLRYDLTLPLARYYAANGDKLPMPFKALQTGSVFRADRPQRGRFRQFTQCDIDILGDPNPTAEIDLISATTEALGKLGFNDLKVKINDRRILKALCAYADFDEDGFSLFSVILDKADKIGLDGVKKDLIEEGFDEKGIEKVLDLINRVYRSENGLALIKDEFSSVLAPEVADNLELIINTVSPLLSDGIKIVYDLSLVRGMGYYTGTIFEIETPAFGAAIAGGGRYDEMIGKFCGRPVPACGFSIGFERIVTLLSEQNFKVEGSGKKKAFLVEKDLSKEKLAEVFAKANALRAEGCTVLVTTRNKNAGFQKSILEKDGYSEFVDVYK